MDEPDRAVAYVREALSAMDALNELDLSTHLAARLAYLLAVQGHVEEAIPLVERARRASADDSLNMAIWLAAQSRLDGSGGDGTSAVRHALHALQLLSPLHQTTRYAMALMDLAAALVAAGQRTEAKEKLREALAVANSKGNLALVRLIERDIAELLPGAR